MPDGTVRLGRPVVSAGNRDDDTALTFEDGSTKVFDVVIGAGGIHLPVRAALWGKDDPEFTGIVSYRGVFPTDRLPDRADAGTFTKWWGEVPENQIVTFPLTLGREIFVFATTPQVGWTLPGDIEELRGEYANFHAEARALLDACDEVTKSALHVREPMETWAQGHVSLLGDAAHPMVPFMAQAAGIDRALQIYEDARKPRTAKVQRASLANDWLKKGGNADWVYGYDAWAEPLE